jgi:nucleoside-diphosphate-sugar epimerase
LSSGAVFGNDFENPISSDRIATYSVNEIRFSDYYGIAKMNSEAKHRSFSELEIVDLRIFGFFSRHISLNSGFFLSDMITCLLNGNIFETNSSNFYRDYVHPSDLFHLIINCVQKRPGNIAVDAYSLMKIGKFELLEHFSKNYGLKYNIREDLLLQSSTGSKSNYYSLDRSASKLGYLPAYDSLSCIIKEFEKIRLSLI